MSGSWVSPRDVQGSASLRLFCFPHAGSGAAAYYRWRPLLPAGVQLCPVNLPGREARLGEPAYRNAEALIAELTRATERLLETPFVIFGHSMGALLGYEWARQLEAIGRHAELLIVSARNAPASFGRVGESGIRPLHSLPDLELVEALAAQYGTAPGDLLHDPELREVFLPILRADLELVETYRAEVLAPLSCPVLAVAGRDDRSVSTEGQERWRSLTKGSFSAALFRGDHYYLHEEGRPELLAFIAEHLAGCLKAPSR